MWNPVFSWRRGRPAVWNVLLGLCMLGSVGAAPGFAQFSIGPDASNYGVLFEGGGHNTLQITNVTVNGNVGVGNTGLATDSGPSTVKGRIDFSAANTGQFGNNNAGNVITGGVHFNVATVANALNAVNSLNASLGAESGNNLNITNASQTINITSGKLDSNGNYVFNVTGFNTTNGDVLTIQGDGIHSVVFNFTGSANFNNQVVLNNIGSDQVLWNFVGGSNLSGGPTLQINTNASSNSSTSGAYGVFLDPNGPVSVTNANVFGRVFGGDSHDFQYVSGSTLTSPGSMPVTPAPSSLVLMSLAMAGLACYGGWRWKLRPALAR
jgi:hypothetical protein